MTLQADADGRSPLPPILILTAGGLEHGGGIGRMVGYLTDEWGRDPAAPPFEVLDTRGAGPWRRWPGHLGAVLWRLARSRRRRPLAYIHVAGRGSSLRKLALVAFCRLLRIPVLLHLHDYDYEQFCRSLPAPLLELMRWMFQAADHVVVLGRDARSTVTGLLAVPAERVSILPNAVPVPAPAPAQADGGPVEILFLGQLSRRKGVHDLIEALDQPSLRDLNWHATIAGGGPLQDEFAASVAATGIADRVTMPGWVDRVATDQLLRTADILVLPSYAEGMAMSVLEGMAHGLCIICTPVGALGEVIEPDRSGVLVEPGDVPSLAAALALGVADAGLRTRLGTAAAAQFRRDFAATDYPTRLLPILERALTRRLKPI